LTIKLKHSLDGIRSRLRKGAPVGIDIEVKAATVALAGVGTLAALLAGATTAQADPGVPVPPPAPPAVVAPVLPGPAPAAPPAQPVAAPAPLVPAAAPAPAAPETPASPAAAPVPGDAAPPAEVPHLASPENLPPGTSMTPQPSAGGSYLRDLWHAVQTQEVSGKDALLLLTQRPMNANATPPPGLSANPAQQMPAAPPPAPGAPLPVTAPAPPAAPAPAPAPAPPTP
jgi:hypothetical protein